MTRASQGVRLFLTVPPERMVESMARSSQGSPFFINCLAFAFVICLLFLPKTAFSQPAATTCLPDLALLPAGWTETGHAVKAIGPKGTPQAFWKSFEIRSPEGESVLVQVLSEPAAGPLYIPGANGTQSDGPLGMGAEYAVSEVNGFRFICETHPYLGSAVTTRLESGATLLAESKTTPVEELLGLCLFILAGNQPEEPGRDILFVIP